ncbi:hypothetical protein F383_16525 [Gossypium arboreum]|uniref:Uncharacterized protein n=1 Tax=Gossypium arboreum TaxID=29729 RepID=A0A0B0PWU9_GOSAR|nr:hypothetical protein F383_16525 [Gossypium arboreum]
MRANVSPCLGHDIGIEMRASCKTMSGTCRRHLTLCLRLSEYPIVFQMVQREIYYISHYDRDYGYVVKGTACQVSSGLEIVGGNITLSSHYLCNNEAYIRNFK